MIKRRKKVYIHIYIYINNPNPRIHQTGSRRGTKSKREYCGCGRFLEDHTFFGLLDRWWFKCCYDCLRTKMSVSVFTFALSTPNPPRSHTPASNSPHQRHSSTPFASTPNTLHTFFLPTLSPTAPLVPALSTPPPSLLCGCSSSSPPALDHPSNPLACPLSNTAPRDSDVRFRETTFREHSRMKRVKRWRSR